jgi:hypothetical protein
MDQEQQSLFDTEIDMIAEDHLRSIARWSRFISVAGFVVIALSLLLVLLGGQKMFEAISELVTGSTNNTWVVIVILVVAAAIWAIWFFFLFRASIRLNNAVLTKNRADLAEGFTAVRNFFIVSIVYSAISIVSTLLTIINF